MLKQDKQSWKMCDQIVVCTEASKWDHLNESFRLLLTHKITFSNFFLNGGDYLTFVDLEYQYQCQSINTKTYVLKV